MTIFKNYFLCWAILFNFSSWILTDDNLRKDQALQSPSGLDYPSSYRILRPSQSEVEQAFRNLRQIDPHTLQVREKTEPIKAGNPRQALDILYNLPQNSIFDNSSVDPEQGVVEIRMKGFSEHLFPLDFKRETAL